jgi:hypothetical protein
MPKPAKAQSVANAKSIRTKDLLGRNAEAVQNSVGAEIVKIQRKIKLMKHSQGVINDLKKLNT